MALETRTIDFEDLKKKTIKYTGTAAGTIPHVGSRAGSYYDRTGINYDRSMYHGTYRTSMHTSRY